MMTKEKQLLKAEEKFQQLKALVEAAGEEELRVDEVERSLFAELLKLGLHLLKAFVAQAGDGDEGKGVTHNKQNLSRQKKSRKRYLSVFGELNIKRYTYAPRKNGKIAYRPLDATLGLPEGDISYVLEDWLNQWCVKEAFEEATTSLHTLLNLKLGVHTAERLNQKIAHYAEAYRQVQPLPPQEEEGELLVVSADGKGVVMRREKSPDAADGSAAERASRRRGKGEKANQKQMSYVGAVYSIDRFRRSSDDVLEELSRRRCSAERPRPCHKRVWAELNQPVDNPVAGVGRERLFVWLASEAHERDPRRKRPLVCLLDGEKKLWELKDRWLDRAIGVLDFYHVSERMWTVAYLFHQEGSSAAQEFVDHRLRMLLEGKVGYVLRDLRRLFKTHKLKKSQRATLESVITYYENNRQHMRYDVYLAAGFPIGSGAIEGACRHLVKDRMERTGMKWRPPGAEAMLRTRASYLNCDWDAFHTYRIETEQQALYYRAA